MMKALVITGGPGVGKTTIVNSILKILAAKGEAFLDALHPDKSACLLIDAYLPGMSGLELLEKLHHDVIACRRS